MTTTTSSPTDSLEIIELKPGLRFSKGTLRDLLPDVETSLFFGKVYKLDAQQLGDLLLVTMGNSDVARALLGEAGSHSIDLQDYVIDLVSQIPQVKKGDLSFDNKVIPQGEILPELWAQLEVEVATSIAAVAEKLTAVVNHMPGKQGAMMFQSMRVMNAKRPVIGDYKARIHHPPQKENLVILDVSSSMSRSTVARIVDDVVSMSYLANAHLAIVSNTTTHWDPGTYGSDDVLREGEFSGTHYETLKDLLSRDWGVVVTVADYDSSMSAKAVIAGCKGHIDEVLDISLVGQPTFLAEVVGQLADMSRPLIMAAAGYDLTRSY